MTTFASLDYAGQSRTGQALDVFVGPRWIGCVHETYATGTSMVTWNRGGTKGSARKFASPHAAVEFLMKRAGA